MMPCNLERLLRVRQGPRISLILTSTVLLRIALFYGVWAKLNHSMALRSDLALSLIVTVTLLHFWYDGTPSPACTCWPWT